MKATIEQTREYLQYLERQKFIEIFLERFNKEQEDFNKYLEDFNKDVTDLGDDVWVLIKDYTSNQINFIEVDGDYEYNDEGGTYFSVDRFTITFDDDKSFDFNCNNAERLVDCLNGSYITTYQHYKIDFKDTNDITFSLHVVDNREELSNSFPV